MNRGVNIIEGTSLTVWSGICDVLRVLLVIVARYLT
jgi:hypothetical protein